MSHRAEIDRLLASPPPDWKRQWANARQQLRALDYDAAAQPDVDDAMQALYLTAGGNESGDPIKGPIPVPAAVRDEAMRALRMAHKHNYGAWNFIGVARAIQLAVVPYIAGKSVDRMRAFFTRHAKDANARNFGNDKNPSRGYLAHLVWGGDPAKTWVNDMERRMRRNPTDSERKKNRVRRNSDLAQLEYEHQTRLLPSDSSTMKIYLVENSRSDYATCERAVIIAASTHQARNTHPYEPDAVWSSGSWWVPKKGYDVTYGNWADPSELKVTLLGNAMPRAKRSVVCADMSYGG